MVAVVLSQDPELGSACAAELRDAGAAVHLVSDGSGLADLRNRGFAVEALVAVPRLSLIHI